MGRAGFMVQTSFVFPRCIDTFQTLTTAFHPTYLSHTAPLPTNVVSGLILAGYTTLFTLVSLMPSGKKEEPVAVVAVKSVSTSAVPSIDDATFGDFIENEANLQKWIDSAE